jgi:hypothetical protein
MIQQRHKLDYISNRIPNLIDNAISSSCGNLIGIAREDATIVTTKVGTFSSTWKGAGTLYFDPGDGGAVEPLVLTSGGVAWNHEYLLAGSKTITITGDLNGVTSLDTSVQGIINSLNDIVKSLTSLTYLTMYGNSITGELSTLSKLMSLTYIRLDGNSIIGELSPLSGLTSLTYLALSAMPSLTGNISSLSGLTSLVTLYLHNGSLTGDLSSLSGLTNLALVYLYNNALTFTYTQFPAWSGSSYYLQSTVSTQREVGDLIRAAANGGMNNCIYKLDGTNPAPPDTQEVIDAISTLAGNAVTLYVST